MQQHFIAFPLCAFCSVRNLMQRNDCSVDQFIIFDRCHQKHKRFISKTNRGRKVLTFSFQDPSHKIHINLWKYFGKRTSDHIFFFFADQLFHKLIDNNNVTVHIYLDDSVKGCVQNRLKLGGILFFDLCRERHGTGRFQCFFNGFLGCPVKECRIPSPLCFIAGNLSSDYKIRMIRPHLI